jgi:hypothetical protein
VDEANPSEGDGRQPTNRSRAGLVAAGVSLAYLLFVVFLGAWVWEPGPTEGAGGYGPQGLPLPTGASTTTVTVQPPAISGSVPAEGTNLTVNLNLTIPPIVVNVPLPKLPVPAWQDYIPLGTVALVSVVSLALAIVK